MHFCGVLKPLNVFTHFLHLFSKCICQENMYNGSSTSISSRKPSAPPVDGHIKVCKRSLHSPVPGRSAWRGHKPMCTLYHCPGSSIPQTPFPRGLMSVAGLLYPIALPYLEPRFNFFVNTKSTCSIFTQHLWVAWAHCPVKGQQGSSGTAQCLARRHCSTIAPLQLGRGGMWETPCRNHISVGAVQGSWSLYAVEHNTTRLAVTKWKNSDKCQPWWSIDWDISY